MSREKLYFIQRIDLTIQGSIHKILVTIHSRMYMLACAK